MVDKAIVEDFIEAIKTEQPDKNRTYSAVVSRIDQEGVVWVSLVGSDKETPTASTSSEVKRGDAVTVEWRNNKLYIVGNSSNPSAGTIRVTDIEQATAEAKRAAESAVGYATEASEAATDAKATANAVEGIAVQARTSADDAKKFADSASVSADAAMTRLATIEDVAGAVNWIAEHGSYQATPDTAVIQGKYYFVQNPDSSYSIAEPKDVSPVTEGWYEYNELTETYSLSADTAMASGKQYYRAVDASTYEGVGFNDANPYANGWKELESVSKSVANYISTYLVLIGDELRLQGNGASFRLSPLTGMSLYFGERMVASYGDTAVIGEKSGFHIEITGTELAFCFGENTAGAGQDPNNRLAYVNGNELYVKNSLAFGNFQFYQRTNGHFTLKYTGVA